MKILIVDDSAENLGAAKQAVENFSKLVVGPEILTPKDSFEEATKRHLVKEVVDSFSEHEFVFTNSAKEAVDLLAEADAVITDLFFPDEGHKEGGALSSSYARFCSGMTDDCIAFTGLWYDRESYYGWGNKQKAVEKLSDVQGLVADGTVRRPVERLIEYFEGKGNQKSADEYREVLKNLPAPQFPYGGALMLHAKELGKFHCLVSDIHSHAGNFKSASSAIDGMMILLPLIEAEIIFDYEAKFDGNDCLTYLGSNEINRFGKGKSDPAAWAEAILRVIIQSIHDKVKREYDQKAVAQ